MLKKISNMKGAKALNKNEQRAIKGGIKCVDGCNPAEECCYYNFGHCSRVCQTAPSCNCM